MDSRFHHGHRRHQQGGGSGEDTSGEGREQRQSERPAVLVVGAGVQGQAISTELARRGLIVYVYDRDVARTLTVQKNTLNAYMAIGKKTADPDLARVPLMTAAAIEQAVSRIRPCGQYRLDEAVRDLPPLCFVFEAVVENLQVKRQVMKQLIRLLAQKNPTAIFATNTLSFEIDDITSNLQRDPTDLALRIIGVRFLWPILFIPQVEVFLGRNTGCSTFTNTWKFLCNLGFGPFLLHYTKGAPRLKLTSNEVVKLYDSQRFDRVASPPAPGEKAQCCFGKKCYSINDRFHCKVFDHHEKPRIPCRWGGMCFSDQTHMGRFQHPPQCQYRPCKRLHDLGHRMDYTHQPVACRYGAECRHSNDEEHRLLFYHPIQSSPQDASAGARHQLGHQHQPEQTASEGEGEAEENDQMENESVEKGRPDQHAENKASSTSAPTSECAVCFDATVDALLYPCGHVALCSGCGNTLKNEGKGCPICRTAITSVVKMFFV